MSTPQILLKLLSMTVWFDLRDLSSCTGTDTSSFTYAVRDLRVLPIMLSPLPSRAGRTS